MLADPYDSSRPETFNVSYGVTSGQLSMSTRGIIANRASQTYSTQLTSLQPGTVYYYRVWSMNKFETVATDEMSFTTKDESEPLLY
jgi:hypothetical protein